MATPLRDNKSAGTRETLLKAAQRVVARDGVSRLTLDTVAQEAGVSKGGVLYHFPTKNALIAAMMENDIAHWKATIEEYQANEATTGERPEAGRFARAFLSSAEGVCEKKAKACREMLGGGEDMTEWFAAAPDLRAGMIAAIAENHILLNRFREQYAVWQSHLEADGLDPAVATAIRLAADGFFIVDMLGLAPPEGELRQRVFAQLQEWATPKESDK